MPNTTHSVNGTAQARLKERIIVLVNLGNPHRTREFEGNAEFEGKPRRAA